jgi:hypothetical protein
MVIALKTAPDEQEEDDAQLGDGAKPLLLRHRDPAQRRHVTRQRAEPVGAKHGAGDKEAKNGAELEALADGHQDGRRREHDHRVAVDGEIRTFRHRLLMPNADA